MTVRAAADPAYTVAVVEVDQAPENDTDVLQPRGRTARERREVKLRCRHGLDDTPRRAVDRLDAVPGGRGPVLGNRAVKHDYLRIRR